MQLRTVGTSAPVSRYSRSPPARRRPPPPPASARASASHGHSASSRDRQEVGRGDHRADMQPADRQQVRQARHRASPPRRLRKSPRGRRWRRPPRSSRPIRRAAPRTCADEPPLERRERAARLVDGSTRVDRALHAAGRGIAGEPCRPGEIVAARQHRRRRRHQPRLQPHHRAFAQAPDRRRRAAG